MGCGKLKIANFVPFLKVFFRFSVCFRVITAVRAHCAPPRQRGLKISQNKAVLEDIHKNLISDDLKITTASLKANMKAILEQSGIRLCKHPTHKKVKDHSPTQPWFDDECKNIKKHLQKLAKLITPAIFRHTH